MDGWVLFRGDDGDDEREEPMEQAGKEGCGTYPPRKEERA